MSSPPATTFTEGNKEPIVFTTENDVGKKRKTQGTPEVPAEVPPPCTAEGRWMTDVEATAYFGLRLREGDPWAVAGLTNLVHKPTSTAAIPPAQREANNNKAREVVIAAQQAKRAELNKLIEEAKRQGLLGEGQDALLDTFMELMHDGNEEVWGAVLPHLKL